MTTLIGDGVDIEEELAKGDPVKQRHYNKEYSHSYSHEYEEYEYEYETPLQADRYGGSYTEEKVNFIIPRSKSEGAHVNLNGNLNGNGNLNVNLLRRTEASLASMGSLVENWYFHMSQRERKILSSSSPHASIRSQKRYRITVCLGILFLLTLMALLTTLGLVSFFTVIQPARQRAALERAIHLQAARDAALVQQCANVTWQQACASLDSAAGARRRRRLEDAFWSSNDDDDDDDYEEDEQQDMYEESMEQEFLHSDDPTVVYDSNCIREYRLTLMWNITFPYRANHLLGNGGSHTLALFIQHGALRDAADYFCSFMHLMRKQTHHKFTDILLIAPHFQYAHDDYLHPRDAFWNTSKPWGDWRNGAESDPKCCGDSGRTVSSFTVLDNMLAILTNQQLYPNLKQISFLGHSAGGQMVQRYAVVSTLAALWDLGLDLTLRFVIANPSSYTYLDNRRFAFHCGNCECNRHECTCDSDCTAENTTITQLVVPTRHGVGTKNPCYQWNYDRWPYGLGSFMNKDGRHIPYALRDGLAGPERALRTYGKLDVVYLVGQNDTCNDGLPNCDKSCWKRDHWLPGENPCYRNQMDIRCPAMLQGPCRRARAYNYMNFLQQLYDRPVHTLWEVPGVGHDATAMFGSDIGLEVLFGP
uniref:Uncharacterized protein n=1 Tax=Amphora coffeiformis TaxID=265554 RepID=A0A7S3L2J7_9STRA